MVGVEHPGGLCAHARQAPEHFMVELWKPHLVPSGLAEQEQASSEYFLE